MNKNPNHWAWWALSLLALLILVTPHVWAPWLV